jgi:hypothetical protein
MLLMVADQESKISREPGTKIDAPARKISKAEQREANPAKSKN